MKKVLFVLGILLLGMCLPSVGQAKSKWDYNNYQTIGNYDVIVSKDKKEVAILYALKRHQKKIVLPKVLDGKRVVCLGFGSNVFRRSENEIQEIVVPSSVTWIGGSCFSECSKLKKVNIPTKVKNISGDAFRGCKMLKKITLPKKISRISVRAFKESGIKEITIPSNIKSIGPSAFEECKKLKSITIQGDIEVEKYAFAQSAIEQVKFLGNKVKIDYRIFRECYKVKKVTFTKKSGLITVNNVVYSNKGKELKLLAKERKYLKIKEGVTSIAQKAFYESKIQKVVLPSTIKTIGRSAFKASKLSKINFPEGLTTIEKYAFTGSKVKTIVIPKSVTQLNYGVFFDCNSLTDITIGAKSINYMILDYYLEPVNITIKKSVEFIDDSFGMCLVKAKSLTVEAGNPRYQKVNNGLVDMKTYTLLGVVVTTETYQIPSIIKRIGSGLIFYGTGNLKTLIVPKSLNTLDFSDIAGNNVQIVYL